MWTPFDLRFSAFIIENFQAQTMKNSYFDGLLRVFESDNFVLLLGLFSVLCGTFVFMWCGMHGVHLPTLKKPRQASGLEHFNVILNYWCPPSPHPSPGNDRLEQIPVLSFPKAIRQPSSLISAWNSFRIIARWLLWNNGIDPSPLSDLLEAVSLHSLVQWATIFVLSASQKWDQQLPYNCSCWLIRISSECMVISQYI